ncbi:hypothetical protein [Nisaea sp.]
MPNKPDHHFVSAVNVSSPSEADTTFYYAVLHKRREVVRRRVDEMSDPRAVDLVRSLGYDGIIVLEDLPPPADAGDHIIDIRIDFYTSEPQPGREPARTCTARVYSRPVGRPLSDHEQLRKELEKDGVDPHTLSSIERSRALIRIRARRARAGTATVKVNKAIYDKAVDTLNAKRVRAIIERSLTKAIDESSS